MGKMQKRKSRGSGTGNKGPAGPGYSAMIKVLGTFRQPKRTGWEDAWVGMEPTFQSDLTVKLWEKMARDEAGEEKYFKTNAMLKLEEKVAEGIRDKYRQKRKAGKPYCMFADVRLETDCDKWGAKRQNLLFHWPTKELHPLRIRVGLDPETIEYSIKPVPLAWLYDNRFVRFLDRMVWNVPVKEVGLVPSVTHGGGQFSLSAKTVLGGSLLADDLAYRLNHPEFSIFLMDWANCDDRAFRATSRRFAACRTVIEAYWAGAFHPRAIGTPTPENCYRECGWGPASAPPGNLMDPVKGPVGSPREVFQTNFAFGRAVRLQTQYVHPGYWQAAKPNEEGYEPEQVMRYSETNLNRFQIAGECHVKSQEILNPERVPELEAPLDVSMLYDEASWEDRAQMCRASARDFVEAVLLDVHHMQYLQAHPHVRIKESILQDLLLIGGEKTVARYGGAAALRRLRQKARTFNLELSHNRIKSDFIEPETLLWEAWNVLPRSRRAAIAHEVVAGLIERVEHANSMDPRPEARTEDPMGWHRHRVLPILWSALDNPHAGLKLRSADPVRRELEAWKADRKNYLKRRPVFSPTGTKPPWKEE